MLSHIHVNQNSTENILVVHGNKIDLKAGKEAIARINAIYDWSHDNEEIFAIFENNPRYCLFAKNEKDLVGYAVLRDDGPDCHYHVSWIATDKTGHGIGQKMMHKIIHKNKKAGKAILTLHHQRNNEKVKKFYENIASFESLNYSCEDCELTICRVTYEMSP